MVPRLKRPTDNLVPNFHARPGLGLEPSWFNVQGPRVLSQCGQPSNKPTIWGWFIIQPICSYFGDGLLLGLPC